MNEETRNKLRELAKEIYKNAKFDGEDISEWISVYELDDKELEDLCTNDLDD